MRCALPADVEVYALQGQERSTFPGRLGLAPGWLTEAMTPREERWVSACILAHVNHFGKSVRVSMRGIPPPVPALEVSAEGHQTYTIFEGGVFGNLFTPEPRAYTCLGTQTPEEAADPILRERVCTEATDATTPTGLSLTRCRLLLTGPCTDPLSFWRGHATREVVHVWWTS